MLGRVFAITSTATWAAQLGGLDDYERDVLNPLRQSVSDLAGSVARVNTQLAAGFTMTRRHPAPAPPNGPLFTFDASGVAAACCAWWTACSPRTSPSRGDPTKPGNSDNLLKVIDLKNLSVTVRFAPVRCAWATRTRQMVGAPRDAEPARTRPRSPPPRRCAHQSEESWKSTSGVNQDEEAVQTSCSTSRCTEANLKVIAVASQLVRQHAWP